MPASGIISSAMQPVIDAVSLAAGRIAFGLGSMAVENVNGGHLRRCLYPGRRLRRRRQRRWLCPRRPDNRRRSTNQAVTCAFHFQQHIGTGPITYTLPRANTLFNGFGFWIYANPAGTMITLAVNANDNFVLGSGALGSGISTSLQPGTWNFVTTNAASSGAWYVRLAPSTASAPAPPGGYLNLLGVAGGGPIQGASDVIAATTVYYTPYVGNRVSVWNGSSSTT